MQLYDILYINTNYRVLLVALVRQNVGSAPAEHPAPEFISSIMVTVIPDTDINTPTRSSR